MPDTLFSDPFALPDGTQTTTPQGPRPVVPADRFFSDPAGDDRLGEVVTEARDRGPDEAARILKLQLKTGFPAALIAQDLEGVERRAAAADFNPEAFRQNNPQLAAWLQQEPQRAALAKDDLENLGAIERTLRVGANSVRALGTGPMAVSAGVWGLVHMGADWAGADALAEFAQGSSAVATHLQQRIRGEGASAAGFVERSVYSGLESLSLSLSALPTAVLGPEAYVAVLGAATAGQAYEQARGEGASVARASGFALGQGAIEAATEMIPAKWFLSDLAAHAGVWRTVQHQLLSELPGEQLATAIQDLNGWAALPSNTDKPFLAYLQERPSQAAQTLIATLVSVGGQGAVVKGLEFAAGKPKSQIVAERLGDAAAASKTLQRAPEIAEPFLAQASADGVSHVYAPVDTFTEYFQSRGEDPLTIATQLTGDPDALRVAQQSGSDLRIPTSRYLAQIAPSEHQGFFAQEVRLAPDEMNGREYATFKAELAAQPESAAAAQTELSPQEQVRARVAEQLVAAGMPAETAQTNAVLAESVFGALAEREGLDPLALYEQWGLTVQRTNLAEAQPGDFGQADAYDEYSREFDAEMAAAAGSAPLGTVASPATEEGVSAPPAPATALDTLPGVPPAVAAEFAPVQGAPEPRPPQELFQGAAPRTKAFKAWFGDSQVVDANGKPLVVYHGSNRRFNVFELRPAMRNLEGQPTEVTPSAFFFTPDKATAQAFAKDRALIDARLRGQTPGKPQARAFYLAIQKPLDLVGEWGQGWNREALIELEDIAGGVTGGDTAMIETWADVQALLDDPAVIAELKDRGYDGAHLREDDGSEAWAVFDPEQIKSPENRGTFDTANPNVLFQEPEAAPVATLTGTELADTDDLPTLRNAADAYYRRELQSGQRAVSRDGLGAVRFSNKGLGHLLHYSGNPNKLRVIPAIPDVIERGHYHGREALRHARTNGIVAFHRFSGTVQLRQVEHPLSVEVLVGEDDRGNLFYDLHVPKTTKAQAGHPDKGVGPGPSEDGSAALEQSIEPDGTDINVRLLGQEKRGSISFDDGQTLLKLFEQADPSTFLHESGHLYLEVLADLAARPAATPQLQADMRTLLDWFGFEGDAAAWRAQSLDAKREAHEQFARGFEAYLFEGRAPSLALRSAFARFRAWLLGVYRSAQALNVRLNPEIRAVFDRIVATDQAIADARAAGQIAPMFTTAASAGMTEAEFALYRQTVADASRTATERLEQQLMAEVSREQTAQWKATRAAVRCGPFQCRARTVTAETSTTRGS